MIIPPLANQPIAQNFPATREHHQFLLGLYNDILTAQDRLTSIEAALGYCDTLGPFHIDNLPGTATTQGKVLFFSGATAVGQSDRDPRVARAGRVVGVRVMSTASRTAGTATVRVRIGGTGTDFDGGSCELNATNLTRSASLVPYSSGLTFTAGVNIGCEVVTSGWTPTTACLVLQVLVRYEAF